MGGQQTSENADGGFENLWPCVHVERDRFDNVLDCRIEPLNIAHHHKRVEDIDERHGIIACNIIGSPVVTADPVNNSVF